VHLRAHAKVNLALSVGPAVADGPKAGYHPIASWVHAVSLWDDVQVEVGPSESRGLSRRPARQSDFDIDWAPGAPMPTEIDWPWDRDLAVRAHRAMEAAAGEPLPVRIRITKRIPVGAGLGGGSSDAAAVMIGVNQVYQLGLPMPRLAELSAEIGSDVAFFLDESCERGEAPRPALVTGFGERVERVAPARSELTLYLPDFACPTAEVYHAYDESPIALRQPDVEAMARAATLDPIRLFNDLLPAAERVRPGLVPLRAGIAASTGATPHLSGSGSTLFVIAAPTREIASVESVRARLV
jgi:4-diphosphocytidyl-2-C-methyl-D-erythritol kinase